VIDVSQLEQSHRALVNVIDAEVAKLGGDASKLALLGYSQGGNIAYHLALRYPQQIAGLIARRTSLRNETAPLGTHYELPILHYHGSEDDSIGVVRGKAGVERLQAAGFAHVQLMIEPGLNHTDFSEEEMNAVAGFLRTIFPDFAMVTQSHKKPECHL
jgi:predicted esterase